jgi:hypothetical protein
MVMPSQLLGINLMSRKAVLNSWLSLVVLLLVLCSPTYAATATLSEMKVSADVDRTTMAPKVLKSEFVDTVADIWATAFLEGAPAGTSVSARWYVINQGEYEKLVENNITAEGSRYIAFRLQPLENKRLPTGDYQVDFVLNGKKVGSQVFMVASASAGASANPAPPRSGAQTCTPSDENDEKLVVSLAAKQPAMQKQLAALKLMRYQDPQNRFSLIVPGAWFQAENTTLNQALYLSQNKADNPVFTFVVSVYKVNLSPKFGALDTVNQLSKMLLDEGKRHGVKVIQSETANADQIGPDIAAGSLVLSYNTSSGKEIGQLHTILVDGKNAIDIQLNGEEKVMDTALFLYQVASQSLWTKRICEKQK